MEEFGKVFFLVFFQNNVCKEKIRMIVCLFGQKENCERRKIGQSKGKNLRKAELCTKLLKEIDSARFK